MTMRAAKETTGIGRLEQERMAGAGGAVKSTSRPVGVTEPPSSAMAPACSRRMRTVAGVLAAAATAAAAMAGVGMFALPASAGGANGYAGTGAVFRIGAGARPLAMGGAFVGLSDDENALFYNPAGLARLGQLGLTSLYSTQYDVVTYGAVGIAGRGFGAGALYLDSGGIPGVGTDDAMLDAFSYRNLAGLVGAGFEVGPLSVGVRGKYLTVSSATLETAGGSERIRPVKGGGYDADAAVLLDLGAVRLGAVYESLLGQGVRYDTGSEEAFERRLVVGVSLRAGPVVLAADLEDVTGNQRFYHAGAEARLGVLALRGGASGQLGQHPGSPDLSAGAGVALAAFQLDYAYLLPAALPATHRLSLTLRF